MKARRICSSFEMRLISIQCCLSMCPGKTYQYKISYSNICKNPWY